ncbi:F-actin-monooxygenase MICAL2 isoform X13 [Rhineura floridana]|uniref:F-actin-monooxygenase MICAL2 isoform X13 n=1 Tax=Rhineura floridana TaxID=261503 RepID=UPI002AC85092|nr:F-actin-monooxygenase MICAL2 isoform X13 [Rhineura floridana]
MPLGYSAFSTWNMGEKDNEKYNQAGHIFENFVQASTCKGTIQAFNILTRQLELDPLDNRSFYTKLKSKVTSWKANALWNKLDKRSSHKEYKRGKSCVNTKCLIVGGGPCGLRTAIELAFLGAKVVVVEKRDTFSRNNVLHLWPFTIHDLRSLGAKKFYGKFCAGSIDHISIRQLQLILFKVALMLGVEIHVNLEFVKVLEPPEDQENRKIGWRAEFLPMDHPLSEYEFDVIIGADGRRNSLEVFRRKEFRGKLAIAITANFINRNTTAEAKVEEISGVAFIFNQKFFQDLKEETGIDLENIVYYKDSTHYFVMTAKKQSLLEKGVIINDYIDTEMLLCGENVDQDNLLSYAREAADFATDYQLPALDFAINHYGQPDVAMFDFTSMYASENAALIRERHRHRLLVALVGDSLLEPFWPMGTGCARGFLAAFDTVWMVKSWAQGKTPLDILAERESIYRLLPQTTPENITKNFDQYTIDPATRYPNLNSSCVRPHQVKHLYITNELQPCPLERANSIRRSIGLSRDESDIRPNKLLTWCQKQTEGYRNVCVTDLTASWRSGLALCAIMHHFRPDLIDFDSLNEEDAVGNNQLAFDIAEREFGIPPITTGKEMVSAREPDKLSMVMYLSKFYELFRGTPLRAMGAMEKQNGERKDLYSAKSSNFIFNNYMNLTFPRKRIPKTEENETSKRRRKSLINFEESSGFLNRGTNSGNQLGDLKEGINQNKVKSMATQLLAKFEENAPSVSLRRQMTVGKVSHGIGAMAEVLVNLYMNDHRPNPFSTSLQLNESENGAAAALPTYPASQACSSTAQTCQGSLKKVFPQSIGGSDICCFCKKRVYVIERLSAEGHFFHRECFKCAICATTLRLAMYAFDAEEGKFYCKIHFAQCKTNNKHRKRRVMLKTHEKEEAQLWQQEEAMSAEAIPENAFTVHSSSEDRSPDCYNTPIDGPISPKKFKNVPDLDFRSRCSPVSSEWALVRVTPEEDLTEHNLLAVRVMVTSDGSSSELDPDFHDEASISDFNKGPLPEPRANTPISQRPLSLSTSLAKGEECCEMSKAANALQRAHSLRDSSTSKKYQNWKKKIQSNFPLLYSKKSGSYSKDTSDSLQSCFKDDLSQTELTYPDKIPEIMREHFKPHSPAFQMKGKNRDKPEEIPSYVPHYSLYNCTRSYPLAHSESTCHVDLTSSTTYPKLAREDYKNEDQHLGNWTVNSEQLTSRLLIKNSDACSVNPDEGDKTANKQHDKHFNKAKNKIMRKLTLSMEQQSKLLALNDAELHGPRTEQEGQGIPEQKNAYFNRYENIPKQSSCGKSQKFSDNCLPVLSSEHKPPKNVDHCPKENTAAQPKSPLRLIANAIKKSIIEPLISPPEGLKKNQDMHAKLPSETTFFNFPHVLARSVSLRNSKSHGDYNVQMQELSVLGNVEKGLGMRSSDMFHFSNSRREECSCDDKGTSFPVHSVHSSPSKSPHKPVYSSCTNTDDVPTLLEKFTLKENFWKSAKDDLRAHNKKNIHYSSLRHRNKIADAVLDGPEQRNNVWNLFSSVRNKIDDRLKNPVSPCTIFDVDEVLNNSSKGEHLGSEHLPVRKQATDYCSSSSDGELEHKPCKTKRTLGRNKMLEKETKQLVKQEELKRLHKAQAIQRLLEEIEEKQRALEVYGVQLERELRGESDSCTQDETQLLHEWFELVLEKNKLMRYESELLIMCCNFHEVLVPGTPPAQPCSKVRAPSQRRSYLVLTSNVLSLMVGQ